MNRKLNEHPAIVLISTVAAICAIIYFFTNSNLPGLLGWDNLVIVDKSGESSSGDEASSIESIYVLDASIEYFPNLKENKTVIGGLWKLQSIHEDAFSFSQSVRVYNVGSPEIECFGSAQYGTALYVDEDGWYEDTFEVDELAQYDYPKGTYGTFSVDMSSIANIGSYICELTVVINQEEYTKEIQFDISE